MDIRRLADEKEAMAVASTSVSGAGPRYKDRVMYNFRELLAFWTEYYQRRGRDRLSIEFSSHLPFSRWAEVVGKFDCEWKCGSYL